MAIIRRFFRGMSFLIVLVILAISGWFFRAEIATWLGNAGGETIVMAEPSPELADRVEQSFLELREGAGSAETRFTETELQSYVRYRLIDQLPEGVEDPAVDLQDSTIVFTAKLDLTKLAVAGDAAANLQRVLGDSARITSEVYPSVGEPGEGRIHLISLQAGVIAVPPFLVGPAAQQFGLTTDGQTVLVEIPMDVVEIRVENEEIILLRDR